MKPNFALSLSFESIRLLHRAAGGWRLVGEVSPEAADLGTELGTLRKTATSLAPDGMRCKLVIPNEQIRYLSVPTADQSLPERRDAARAALAAATPYAVDDLAFDIAPDGDTTHVAAVARETLAEAESFATEHRFNPISFVAIPEENPYLGEPYFGPSKAALALLEPDQRVEPDGIAIVIVGDVEAPEGPVVESTAAVAVPSAPPPATPAPSFKSARQKAEEAQASLNGALASLRPKASKIAEVASPDLPPRDVAPQIAAFSSRRRPEPAPNPTYEQTPTPPHTGFAEPAEPFVPKPPAPRKPRSVRTPVPAPAPIVTAPESEAARLTVFGARDIDEVKTGGRSLPMGLAAVLLLGLVGIGTWSLGGLQDGVAGWLGPDAGTRETTAIEVAPPVQPGPDPDETTGPEGDAIAMLEPGLTDEDAAVLDALRAPLVVDETPDPSPDDLRASYAVTGIWPQAPDVPSPPPLVDIEDLYVTSIDPIEPAFDAVALPQVASFDKDFIFDAPASPAAAGTTFAFDARGLVIPTAAGTLNPDGVTVFAGAPPLRPAAFPSRDTPEVAADPVQTALAAFRPRTRPGDLVENTERATLDGLTRSELAELRPPARPAPCTLR